MCKKLGPDLIRPCTSPARNLSLLPLTHAFLLSPAEDAQRLDGGPRCRGTSPKTPTGNVRSGNNLWACWALQSHLLHSLSILDFNAFRHACFWRDFAVISRQSRRLGTQLHAEVTQPLAESHEHSSSLLRLS